MTVLRAAAVRKALLLAMSKSLLTLVLLLTVQATDHDIELENGEEEIEPQGAGGEATSNTQDL